MGGKWREVGGSRAYLQLRAATREDAVEVPHLHRGAQRRASGDEVALRVDGDREAADAVNVHACDEFAEGLLGTVPNVQLSVTRCHDKLAIVGEHGVTNAARTVNAHLPKHTTAIERFVHESITAPMNEYRLWLCQSTHVNNDIITFFYLLGIS